MEVALSTKHFNMPVKADDLTLDYRSYVRGLLHCPVCHEAVFFRKSHERNGKRIKNSFAHYSGNPDSCELRVKQAQGRELLEKAKIESHGQRLQYYNDHLWDMAKSHIVVDKRSRNWLRKLLGDRFFNNACRDLRAYTRRKSHRVDTEFGRAASKLNQYANLNKNDDRLALRNQYAHYSISKEILRYLLTSTGTYCLRLFMMSHMLDGIRQAYDDGKLRATPDGMPVLDKKQVNQLSSAQWLEVVTSLVVFVPWQERFETVDADTVFPN